MLMGLQLLAPLVFAVMLGGGWAFECPNDCSCHQFSANCTFLPNKGGKLEALTLLPNGGTHISLSDGQFKSFKNLKYLTLRNASIYEVHKKTFSGANNIVEIDLSFNRIEELDQSVFMDLANLTKLSLRGNPINLVSQKPFLLSNSISHLDIGQCKIRSNLSQVFYELKQLKTLYLDGNLIESVDYESFPKELQYLDLANNPIENVPCNNFFYYLKMSHLRLARNQINCSCPLMDCFSEQNGTSDDTVICTLLPKGANLNKVNENELCQEKSHNKDEGMLSDQPESQNLLGNNDTLPVDGKEANNENQDSTKMEKSPSDLDDGKDQEIMTTNMLSETGNMTSTASSDETSDGADKITSSPSSKDDENPNLGIVNSQNNISENEVHDKNVVVDYTTPIPENSNVNSSESNTEVTVANAALEFGSKDLQVLPEFEKEEFLNVSTKNSKVDTNITSSYFFADNDDNLDYSGDGSTPFEDNEYITHQNLTSTTEINYSTIVGNSEEVEVEATVASINISPSYGLSANNQQNATKEAINATQSEFTLETTSIVTIENELPEHTELFSTPQENEQSPPTVNNIDLPTTETSNNTAETLDNSRVVNAQESQPGTIQEMAGAEVVMFCVAILVICLILYSVYKCRGSKNRESMRNVKDVESNHGTELQDMASLLPKPEEKEEKKNNLKYEDKAPSSETVKLLTEHNENDSSNFTPVGKKKLEDKNSLNNNTPSSKVPLIKPEKPVTISPAAPIQRTKVKVGIIPDSIPRTPIFLQKTYNGTKNV